MGGGRGEGKGEGEGNHKQCAPGTHDRPGGRAGGGTGKEVTLPFGLVEWVGRRRGAQCGPGPSWFIFKIRMVRSIYLMHRSTYPMHIPPDPNHLPHTLTTKPSARNRMRMGMSALM